jgi:hypothetical protein
MQESLMIGVEETQGSTRKGPNSEASEPAAAAEASQS